MSDTKTTIHRWEWRENWVGRSIVGWAPGTIVDDSSIDWPPPTVRIPCDAVSSLVAFFRENGRDPISRREGEDLKLIHRLLDIVEKKEKP